jgi:UPF0716 protein FxsA
VLVRLLFLFTVVPLVELALLLWIGAHTSWWFTLGLVVFTGVAGAWLARHQGLRCLRRFQQELAEGKLPADPLLDGLMILLAGALLVTPGVLTDALGFALLLPPFRRLVRGRVKRRIEARAFVSGAPGWVPPGGPQARDQIIDVKVIDPEHRETTEDESV